MSQALPLIGEPGFWGGMVSCRVLPLSIGALETSGVPGSKLTDLPAPPAEEKDTNLTKGIEDDDDLEVDGSDVGGLDSEAVGDDDPASA